MTDEATSPGRVDLRAIAADPDFANVNRVMAAVLAARGATSAVEELDQGVFSSLVERARPLAAAAAILLAASLATLTLIPDAPSSAPDQALATWVQSNHVPTNAELLSTFEGYDR